MELKKLADHVGVAQIADKGALSTNTGAQNLAAIQAVIDAIPSRGGRLVITPAQAYEISDTIALLDRKAIVIDGQGQHGINATGADKFASCLKVASGWASTKAMFRVTASGAVSHGAKGGVKFTGLFLYAGLSGEGTGGYGIHALKGTPGSDFWGEITLDDMAVFNANIGLFLDDASGNGFGWIRLNNARLQAGNWGIYSNTTVNDLHATGCIIRQNKQSSASSYLTHTGGGVCIPSGHTLTFHGGDYEGQQVAFHLGSATTGPSPKISNVDIRGIYVEVLFDCMASILGADDVLIENVSTDTGAYRTKHIYVQDCKRITQRNNGESFFIVAPNCRDLVTDTPKLTRFTNTTAGSQTLEDYGTWIHSIPSKQPLKKVPRAAHYPLESILLTNVTLSAHSGSGPFGGTGKALVAQASDASSSVRLGWNTTQIPAVLNDFIVITVRLFYPTTNSGSTASGGWSVYEDINGGGYTYRTGGPVSRRAVSLGEWVTWQWVHKVVAADISGGACLYRALLLLTDASGATDPFVFAGAALTVSDTPAVDPMDGVISCEADGSEFQYYLHDGNGVYYGAAEPTGSLISWKAGEDVVFTAPAPSGNRGTTCTTAGTGGGTAVFKSFGVIEAP